MALKGLIFNAGQTSFITPGTDEACPTDDFFSLTYPETLPNGVTCGVESCTGTTGVQAFDLNASLDRRLAGCWTERNTGDTVTFRTDLDATGSKDLFAAFGTDAYNFSGAMAQFYDNNTSLGGNLFTGCSAGNYRDATGVNRTTANWPTQNAANTQSFASTIWRTVIGDAGATSRCPIAYLGYDTPGGGGAVTPSGRRSLLGVGS